jgi:3-oxoacyl-[acyl-carrier protein] reductase
MKINLKGKTSLICASSRGLGFSCAENLASSGSNIILTGRSKENLEVAKSAILKKISNDNGAKIIISTIQVNLYNRANIKAFLNKLADYPALDILVLNNGGPAPGNFESFESVSDFEKKSSAITYAATSLIKHVLPSMRKNKFGRIINISSIGLAKPITDLAVSNASRAYLGGLMTGIANENAAYGITLNTILPGIIWTDRQLMLTENEAKEASISLDDMIKEKAASIPTGAMGKPDDVGTLATFLSSVEAGYINSQFISVDGGLLGLLR